MKGTNGLENERMLMDGCISNCITICEKGIYSNIFCHKKAEKTSKLREEEKIAPEIKCIGGMK
jgi:hypothetical protein